MVARYPRKPSGKKFDIANALKFRAIQRTAPPADLTPNPLSLVPQERGLGIKGKPQIVGSPLPAQQGEGPGVRSAGGGGRNQYFKNGQLLSRMVS